MVSWLMRASEQSGFGPWLGTLYSNFWQTTLLEPTMPLSTQVYEWVLVSLMLGDNPAMDLHPIQEGGGGGG